MIPFILVVLIISAFLLSSLFIYVIIQSRENFKALSINKIPKIKYSIQPTMNIITRRLSYGLNNSTHCISNITRSQQSYVAARYPYRRRSSIIDSKQIAQVQFSLPTSAERYRRQSVAICNNIIESKQSTIDSLIKTIRSSNQAIPCLVSFSIIHLKSSQMKIQFHSFTSLPATIQELTIKIKIIPDGKVKQLTIKQIATDGSIFADEQNQYITQFTNVSAVKLHEKSLVMKFSGKDQAKKTIHLGQIGKIHFNEIKNFEHENPVNFNHAIELIKSSTIEILVSLEQNNQHNLLVDIKRIKGLKIDQKNLNATCFFRVVLLDRHRPLSTYETKPCRLNSSTFALDEPINFNILAFNSTQLDRLMILIDFYSNANHTSEHQCLARVKLASPYLCSGTGTIHWQQFKERQSFSMWHALIKQ